MKFNLDEIDKKILSQLEKNGRVAISIIAEELGVSNTMIIKRINKLIKNEIILSFSPIYDEKKIGYGYSAFTGIFLKEESETQRVINELKKIPEIVSCHYVSGGYTLYIKIYAKDQDDLRQLLYNKIDNIPGIIKTESMLDLGCAFKRNISF